MSQDLILTQTQDNAFIITLNRTDKRNALSMEMCYSLENALDAAAENAAARAVIINGNGPGFSSGVDFFSLALMAQKCETGADFRRMLSRLQGVYTRIEHLEKPVIAAMHGFCIGMAWELALAADFRIATADTLFSMPEVQLGLIPDVGGTSRLTRLAGIPAAKELILMARRIDAKRAYQLNLVNEIVAPDALMETALRWVAELKSCAPLAVGLAKKIIHRGAHLDSLTFMELEAYAQTTLLKTADVQEGVAAKMQKRDPVFKGK
jgi:enoyl-CoA hydratase/carnithine racemase